MGEPLGRRYMLPKGREVPESGREFANARQGPEARARVCRSF